MQIKMTTLFILSYYILPVGVGEDTAAVDVDPAVWAEVN